MTQDATHVTDQVRALFDRCLDLDPAQRATVLAGVGDATVRAQVEDLLRALESPVPVIDTLLEYAAPLADPANTAPARIGHYRVLRELGRGGMGTVYLAEQDEPRRRVAVKRIAGSLAPPELARFRREANLLAQLAHAGIAQIYDAGLDATGTPYLAMEYVEGRTLRDYSRALTRADRLALLARVCDAVDHAHGRGVVHRDLKPANILVRDDGQPKILDFGIARSLAGDGDGLTETGMLLGTPAYMSPEQASGQHAPIDARSDVYALGVIGYELMADRLPLSVSGLTPLQAMRLVAEETAPPLSRLDPTLRGDLETIFAKALAKDPAQRYASAAALGDDLRRHLAHEPIRARAPSVAYRAVKFAQRKPALVAAIAVAVLALVGGAAIASWFAIGERAERVRAQAALAEADEERERAESTVTFVTTLLAEANPARSGRPDVAVRDVLQRALPRVEALPPRAQGPLLLILADAMSGYGAGAQALPIYERATALLREYGSSQADGANVRWVHTLVDVGRVQAARKALQPLLDRRDALEPLDAERADGALGRIELAVSRIAEAQAIRTRLEAQASKYPRGEVPPDMLIGYDELGILAEYHRVDELLALHAKLSARAGVLLGAEHPFTLGLATFDFFRHTFVERDDVAAIEASKAAYERHRQVLGDAHHLTLHARTTLASAYLSHGRFEEAFREFGAALETARRALPSDSVFHLSVHQSVLFMRARTGNNPDPAEAIAVYDGQCRGSVDVTDQCVLLALSIATAQATLRREQDALAWLDAALPTLAARMGPNSSTEAFATANVADLLAIQGFAGSARVLAERGERIFAVMQPTEPRRLTNLRLSFAYTYNRLEDYAKALPHAEHVHVAAKAGGTDAPFLASATRVYGVALIGLGRYDEAERILADAWAHEMARPPLPIDRADVARTYVRLYKAWGKEAEAERWTETLVAQIDAGAELPVLDKQSWGWIEEWRKRHPGK